MYSEEELKKRGLITSGFHLPYNPNIMEKAKELRKNMTPAELQSIMTYLREKVSLGQEEAKGQVIITFNVPTEEEMIDAGLNADGVKRILCVKWWEEMVADIVETPELCDPEESPQQVLEYAKDVVSEYIRKRFPLNGE